MAHSEQDHDLGSRSRWMRSNGNHAKLCSDAELMRNVWDRYDAQESNLNTLSTLITGVKKLTKNGVAGMIATAASATMSNVVGMMGSIAGLSLQSSKMKLQCIDRLIRLTLLPFLKFTFSSLPCNVLSLCCECFPFFSAPLFNAIVIQKPGSAGDAPIRAPPALNFTLLPVDDPSTKQLEIVRDNIESNWPALFAALSFVIATNLSDEIFVDYLASYPIKP
ncbi:hypothetical protein C8R42DRAFT_722379 [Lentinula raphanica]|nr:hypothetical protein C8R42DRAFT_722379 [Lentinula raphanica]